MSIKPSDLKAYTKFVEARGRRTDMDAEFVRARIERLRDLMVDGASRKTPPEKTNQWRDEVTELFAVARVMAAMEDGGDQSAAGKDAPQ